MTKTRPLPPAPSMRNHSNFREVVPKVPTLDLPLDFVCGARLFHLDLLRGLAILLVLYGHVMTRMPQNTFAAGFLFILRQSALIGVDLFLVLSGFFTAGYLFAEYRDTGCISYGRFFVRRAVKLYPSYLLAIGIMFVWQVVRAHHGTPLQRVVGGLRDIWVYLAHIQNYLAPRSELFIQAWTISLVIQFYVAFSLLLLVLIRLSGSGAANPFRAVPWIFAASIPICLFLRYRVANESTRLDPWIHRFPLHLRIDELLAGVWLAYLVVFARPALERLARFWPALFLASIGMMLPAALRAQEAPRFLDVWGFTLAGFGCAGLVLLAWAIGRAGTAKVDARRSLPYRMLAGIGVCSYSIYLWHLPLGPWLGTRVGNRLCGALHLWGSPLQYWVMVGVYFGVAMGISLAGYFLVEKPARFLHRTAKKTNQ